MIYTQKNIDIQQYKGQIYIKILYKKDILIKGYIYRKDVYEKV